MIANNIIIDVSLGQTRVGIIEDRELVEFYIEDERYNSVVGNVYKGKVVDIFPGMEAAFVDIGMEKNAFLYVGDAIPKINIGSNQNNNKNTNISDVVKCGQEILLQIIKEPHGTKGCRVTRNISLPGRDIILIPNSNQISISRRIENEDERERLKEQVMQIKPEGFGIIVRTAAQGHNGDDFGCDVDFLKKLWDKICEKERISKGPQLIYKDLNIIERTVRDMFTVNTNKLVVNDINEYNNVLEFVEMLSPSLKVKVELYNKSYNIFEFYNIESKISKALSRKVWLKSGGYLIIDKTEALTVVDVNTGKFVGSKNLEETIFKTNIEAANEIAKQIRLRDIGGIIIIDFIDMSIEENKKNILIELEKSLKRDRTKTVVVGITELGLVEITRKKVRQNLSSKLQIDCPCCSGNGQITAPEIISRDIERRCEKIFLEKSPFGLIVKANPLIIKTLEGNGIIREIRNRYKKIIDLKEVNTSNIENFEVIEIDNIKYLC